jgi:multidrug efflux pump subunit AcrA (membrane-fusion protein)
MNKVPSSMKTAAREGIKLLALAVLLVALMLWLSGRFVTKIQAGAPPAPESPAPPVASQPVELRQFPLIVEQVGTVQTRTQAQVAGRIMAQVREVLAHDGQTVIGADGGKDAQPTLLARLDGRDIEAKLKQAQAQVASAEQAQVAAAAQLAATEAQQQAAEAQVAEVRTDFKRVESLYAQKAATGQQMDHARSQRDVAEAQARAAAQQVNAVRSEMARVESQKQYASAAVQEAQVMLSYTTIQAPFSGRIIRKMIDVGDTITPGQALFLIETSGEPELHAAVAESLATKIAPDQKLEVRIETIGAPVQGTVRAIVPQADPRSRTMLVKIALPAQTPAISGQFGTLAVPTGAYQALVVPTAAVRQVGQLNLVDVLDAKGVPHRRFVTLGPRHGAVVEVLSGLKQGEPVVTGQVQSSRE